MARFLRGYLFVETFVAGAFYVAAAAILFADVVAREIFSTPIWGGQRIAVLLSNGAALIGIGVATALNRHIRPNILDGIIPARFEPIVVRAGSFFSALIFFGGAWFGMQLMLDNRSMGFTTPPLTLQIWIAQLALPYGLASAGMRALIFAFWPELCPKAQEHR